MCKHQSTLMRFFRIGLTCTGMRSGHLRTSSWEAQGGPSCSRGRLTRSACWANGAAIDNDESWEGPGDSRIHSFDARYLGSRALKKNENSIVASHMCNVFGHTRCTLFLKKRKQLLAGNRFIVFSRLGRLLENCQALEIPVVRERRELERTL